jgi:radical SAM superfamily enzyme YgiQ (UPF0313 family)
MRVLLVHPEFPRTYWGFQHSLPLTGKRATLPPLGLITLAAHLPADWTLRLVDLNVETLDDAALAWADVVMVGGMLVQAPSMLAVLARARAAGRRTIAGGPAPTTSPELFAAADVVFQGEIEGREAEVVAAARGQGPPLVAPPPGARPALAAARSPRYDLLRFDAYVSMSVQASRGCPFHCEFCDVIEIFGRVPRLKTPVQLLAELDALFALGWRGSVFVVDDNFIGNIKETRRLLPGLARWQDERGRPFELYTEASVNLAADEGLLADMVAAGFTSVFVGIETPSTSALRAAGKTQNLRMDLREAVDRITAAGIEVMAGFIVGFDGDDEGTFEAQRRFLADAPIPLAMVGVLTALPGTALWRRLEREGRLRERSSGQTFARPNFVPAMDEAVLLRRYAELIGEVYSPDAYLRRCRAVLATARRPPGPRRPRAGGWKHLARAVWRLGVRGERRRLFWSLLAAGARRGSAAAFTWAVAHAIQSEHLIRYTREDVLPALARGAGEDLGVDDAHAAARDRDRPELRQACQGA